MITEFAVTIAFAICFLFSCWRLFEVLRPQNEKKFSPEIKVSHGILVVALLCRLGLGVIALVDSDFREEILDLDVQDRIISVGAFLLGSLPNSLYVIIFILVAFERLDRFYDWNHIIKRWIYGILFGMIAIIYAVFVVASSLARNPAIFDTIHIVEVVYQITLHCILTLGFGVLGFITLFQTFKTTRNQFSHKRSILLLEFGISFILLGKALIIAFNHFVPVFGDNFYIVTHFLFLVLFELIPVIWLLWVYIDTTKVRTFGENRFQDYEADSENSLNSFISGDSLSGLDEFSYPE